AVEGRGESIAPTFGDGVPLSVRSQKVQVIEEVVVRADLELRQKDFIATECSKARVFLGLANCPRLPARRLPHHLCMNVAVTLDVPTGAVLREDRAGDGKGAGEQIAFHGGAR